ncbi:MAG: Uncharacterised protein [Opitutia bacterium UBA7350]|nr:MAG: Uncharacterised protein [Opitutae bacterium UBA7350]
MLFDQLKADLEIITQVAPLPDGEPLFEVLRRLDQAVEEDSLPSQLEHYLSRRSYLKALAWLENPELTHEK